MAALATAISLAGCGGSSLPPPCPQPAILELAQSANFGLDGFSDDPRRVVYRAELDGFGGGCNYRSDGVLLRYTLEIEGVTGPAYDGRALTVPYFVAVRDPQGNWVDKQFFTAELPRPLGRERLAVVETIEQVIAGVGEPDGPGWRVYFGLDLPPEVALRRERDAAGQSGTAASPSGPASTRP